jgi:ribosomal protein L11 methyltransferase
MPFSQSKDIYKVYFKTKYKYIELFEELFTDNTLSTSQYEVESNTIDSLPDDIWCFEVYLNKKPDVNLLKKQIDDYITSTNIEVLGCIELEQIEDKDWVAFYHKQLKPIEIGNFFIGAHSHQDICPHDKVGIFIEAARAFGSGGHDTTAGCIEGMEKLSHLQFNNVIDIGTGSGILSLVAEKLWSNAIVFGCDIDEVSIDIAHQNKQFNNSQIRLFNNSADIILIEEYTGLKFDLVISNILANPLITLANQIKNLSQKNAYIILSGFLKYQLNEIINAYSKYGFEIYDIMYKNYWVVLILRLTSKAS